MEYTFEVELFEGHLLFNYAEHVVLIDTGSLCSVSDSGLFEFIGVQYTVKNSFMDICVGYLAHLMGFDFDIIMGMDIFSKYNVHIDYLARKITFSDEQLRLEGSSSVYILSNPGEVMCIPIKINGRSVRSIVDTEAEVSYLKKSFILDEIKDFFDNHDNGYDIGNFHTKRYKIKAELAGMTFDFEFGTLPDVMGLHLDSTNVEAIIGYDLFNAFDVVLNWSDRIMLVRKHDL